MSQIVVQVPQNADGSVPDVLVQFVPYVAPASPPPVSPPPHPVSPPPPPAQAADAVNIGAYQTGDADTLPSED